VFPPGCSVGTFPVQFSVDSIPGEARTLTPSAAYAAMWPLACRILRDSFFFSSWDVLKFLLLRAWVGGFQIPGQPAYLPSSLSHGLTHPPSLECLCESMRTLTTPR
jgi:hypothetical protein